MTTYSLPIRQKAGMWIAWKSHKVNQYFQKISQKLSLPLRCRVVTSSKDNLKSPSPQDGKYMEQGRAVPV